MRTRSCAPHPTYLRPCSLLCSPQSVLRYIQTLHSRWLEMNMGGSGQKGVFLILMMGWLRPFTEINAAGKAHWWDKLSSSVLTTLSLKNLWDIQVWSGVSGKPGAEARLHPVSRGAGAGRWKETEPGSSRLKPERALALPSSLHHQCGFRITIHKF